ncbi:unnamed protein product [Heligmosomoides polygyrus]|uniref:UBA_6 domain-containing protein n=1 Tax=Heligmosomoides polygyrus TaxID=6339 RepID=A0A183FL03_HELPZ|nr:unnamed protein product [Heligmosomoides polygyrus]
MMLQTEFLCGLHGALKKAVMVRKIDFGDGAWSEEGSKLDESKLNFIRGYCPGLLTVNGNKVGAVSEDDLLDGDSDVEDLSKEVFKIQPSVFSCMNMSLLLWVHLQEDSTRDDSTEWSSGCVRLHLAFVSLIPYPPLSEVYAAAELNETEEESPSTSFAHQPQLQRSASVGEQGLDNIASSLDETPSSFDEFPSPAVVLEADELTEESKLIYAYNLAINYGLSAQTLETLNDLLRLSGLEESIIKMYGIWFCFSSNMR